MTSAHLRRLRTERSLPPTLREALRELPNAPPEATQLDELRRKLGLAAPTLQASAQPLPLPDRRARERRLRRTVVALVFFPIAATAAVGTVFDFQQEASRSVAAVASSAVTPARSGAQRSFAQTSLMPGGTLTVASAVASAASAKGGGATPPLGSGIGPLRSPRAAAFGSRGAERATVATRPLESKQSALTEVDLLQHANADLRTDPARALALVAEHRQRFSMGNLGQERDVIAIKALVAMGDAAHARENLTRFERAYPGSAYALELRGIVP